MGHLLQAWRLVRREPLLILVPLVFQLTGSAVVLSVLRWTLRWALEGWTAGDAGGLLASLVFIALAPAAASGYNAMVRAAVEGRPAGLETLGVNLGRYYLKILAGAAAAYTVVVIVDMVLGFRGGWLFRLAAVIGAALAHLWLAAVVCDGHGVLAGLVEGWRELVRRPGDYAAILILPVLAGLAAPVLLGPWVVNGGAGLHWLWQGTGSHLTGMLVIAAGAIARVGVFSAYVHGRG